MTSGLGVTSAALSKIIGHVSEEPPEKGASEWQLNHFTKKEYAKVAGIVDLPLESGGSFAWSVARPDRLLQHMASESDAFALALGEAVGQAGTSPLNSVWYLDEVVPGNLLRPDNKRKFWAIYMSFLEFGVGRLFKSEFWLPVAVLRTSISNSVLGGVSQCMKQLFRHTLFDPCRMVDVGCVVKVPEPKLVRMTVRYIIGDEAALKSVWSSKGASGIRPCLFCSNVVSKASGLAAEQPTLVDTTCSTPDRFQMARDNDIWRAFDSLARDHGRLNRQEFAIAQRASGPCMRRHC